MCVCIKKLFDFKPEIPEPCSHRFRDFVPTLKFSASVGLYSCPCFLFIIIFLWMSSLVSLLNVLVSQNLKFFFFESTPPPLKSRMTWIVTEVISCFCKRTEI